MFHSRKTEDLNPAPRGAETEKPTAMATFTSNYQPPAAATAKGKSTSAHSIVDECLTMKGDLESDGDILVKGKVKGNIREVCT